MKPVERLPADVAVRTIAQAGDPSAAGGGFVYDGPLASDPAGAAAVILPHEPPGRARELLAGGVRRIYIGQAALADSTVVQRLAAEFGGGRVGVYVPAKRMEVGWAIDSVSNADFKFMRPSICEPCWEVLDRAGGRTGTHAGWWIGEMLALGASSALLRVDIEDDDDLNICAGLVERFGERLWIGPLEGANPQLGRWVEEGKARRIALPAEYFLPLVEEAA